MKRWLGIILSVCILCLLGGCESTDSNKPSQNSNDKNSAVVYFSGTGNTKAIAQDMAQKLNISIYEIIPSKEYTSNDLNYSDDNCRANKEQKDDAARPEIENDLSEVTKCSTIYLGYPIWWGTNPKIIQTFMDKYDLSDKTVYTFCTSGGSGIETSVTNLQKLYPDVNIMSGHRFEIGDSKDDILDWINDLK